MKVGDIYFADLSPVVGNEVGGIRPCNILIMIWLRFNQR